jgi:hypothetical protein
MERSTQEGRKMGTKITRNGMTTTLSIVYENNGRGYMLVHSSNPKIKDHRVCFISEENAAWVFGTMCGIMLRDGFAA